MQSPLATAKQRTSDPTISMIPDRRGSDEAQPEKRLIPAKATKSDKGKDPTQPEKRLMPAEATESRLKLLWKQFVEFFIRCLCLERSKISDQNGIIGDISRMDHMDMDYLNLKDKKISDEPEYYNDIGFREEPHPAGRSLNHIADKTSQVARGFSTQITIGKLPNVGRCLIENVVKMHHACPNKETLNLLVLEFTIFVTSRAAGVAGDFSTQIIQEKPQVVGDCSTENAKKIPSYCMLCNKNTDHSTFDCPDKETAFLRFLNHIADKNSQVAGDFSTQIIQEKPQVVGDCSTENAEKMLSYCMVCNRNTDHGTFNCPDKETAFVWYEGVYMPNFCDLCNKIGHVGPLCPLDSDSDVDYDPPGMW